MYMQAPDTAAEKEIPVTVFSPALVIAIFISAYGVLSLGLFPSTYLAMVKLSFLTLL